VVFFLCDFVSLWLKFQRKPEGVVISLVEESRKLVTQEKVHRYICPGCAASQEFEPKDGCLVCPYCGRKEEIPTSAENVQERSYEQYLNSSLLRKGVLAENALDVNCSACGATVTFPKTEVAGECAFCGTRIVAQPKDANPLLAPESLLPFRITQHQATDSIKRWLSGLWFAPNALKRFASQDVIKGIYLPFWTYDTYTVSHYTGERGEYYHDTETYTETDSQGNRVTKTRTVRRTRWYSASGTVSRWFDDVLIPATKSLPQSRLDKLSPWDLPELRPYEPAFLSGYKAQCYQVNIEEGFEVAKDVMAGEIRSDIVRDIGGDEQRIHSIKTSYSAITFKHILLPVYLASYRFNQKLYQVMVNARTGEVQGERPYSKLKITLFILMLVAVIALIYYFKQ
jgi:DNA-directed RNA polymerase subunit RPC12/RpoP